jgi:hypothetical protein
VLEPHIGHLADQIGDQPAHHGRGQRGSLFERTEEIEGQGLAGQQVGPETLDVDDGADFTVSDFVLDEGD